MSQSHDKANDTPELSTSHYENTNTSQDPSASSTQSSRSISHGMNASPRSGNYTSSADNIDTHGEVLSESQHEDENAFLAEVCTRLQERTKVIATDIRTCVV